MARHGQRLRLARHGGTVADWKRTACRIGRGRLAASGLATALQNARHGARAMEVPKEAARRLGAILGDFRRHTIRRHRWHGGDWHGMANGGDWHGQRLRLPANWQTVADASGGIDARRHGRGLADDGTAAKAAHGRKPYQLRTLPACGGIDARHGTRRRLADDGTARRHGRAMANYANA